MSKVQRMFAVFSLAFLICGIYFVLLENKNNNNLIVNDSPDNIKIFIHISGAVLNPDLYEFDYSPRVKDVIDKAGGLSKNADNDFIQKNLNYAQLLLDQTKIYIPKIGEVNNDVISINYKINENSKLSQQTLIKMNSSSLKELDSLPGIGEVTAKKIISNRPYSSVDELVFKKILKNSVYQKIKDNISL